MFPGQYNIPGHSGTAQKHRKAFAKSRDRQKQVAYSNEGSKGNAVRSGKFRHYYGQHKLGRILTAAIGIPLILAALLGLGVLLYGIGDSYVDSQVRANAHQPKIEIERDDAYNFYTRLGNRWLLAGDMEEARLNFGKALEIAPYGQNARFALAEILEKMCQGQGLYCEDANSQRDFIQGMGWSKNVPISEMPATPSH